MKTSDQPSATESRSQHTPGPWEVLDLSTLHATAFKDASAEIYPAGRPNGGLIASVHQRPEHSHLANARLIAAAPELLALAKFIVSYNARGIPLQHLLSKASDAIAKAEGRS